MSCNSKINSKVWQKSKKKQKNISCCSVFYLITATENNLMHFPHKQSSARESSPERGPSLLNINRISVWKEVAFGHLAYSSTATVSVVPLAVSCNWTFKISTNERIAANEEETQRHADLKFIHGVYFLPLYFIFCFWERKAWSCFGEMVRTAESFGYLTRRIQNIKQLTVRINDDWS